MGATLIPVLVNAEVAALPTEVKLLKAAISGISALFHHHAAAAKAANTPPTPSTSPLPAANTDQVKAAVLADIKAFEPLALALVQEFAGITIQPAQIPQWEKAVTDAISLISNVHGMINPAAGA